MQAAVLGKSDHLVDIAADDLGLHLHSSTQEERTEEK